MKRALIIRHAAPESLADNFQSIFEAHGFHLDRLDLFESAPHYDLFNPPELDDISLILILGGPMSANDDLPALHQERNYLRDAMSRGVPVFGICLGAQLMSTALGGVVESSGGYQFGLRNIMITADGDSDPVFSKITVPLVPTLHGDCFSIPPGAVKLAEGFMMCRDAKYRRINMAFRYNNSYAFQFEPQLTLDELKVWHRELWNDYQLMGSQFDPEEEAARNLREFAKFDYFHQRQMRGMLLAFLDNAGLAN